MIKKKHKLDPSNHCCDSLCRCERAVKTHKILDTLNRDEVTTLLDFAGVVPNKDIEIARGQLLITLAR